MKRTLPFLLAITLSTLFAHGRSRSSASYFVLEDSIDATGGRLLSASYAFNGTAAGEFGAGANGVASSGSYIVKAGLVGQLYDILGFVIGANPTTLPEGGILQLLAGHLVDDGSLLQLPATAIAWSVQGGPLVSISADGIATADIVYTDTNASVMGTFGSASSSLMLTVLNLNSDDLPGYAGDGIDDDWQVQYFGLPPNPSAGPNIDADGSGLGNLFKFVAGLNPLDGSRFDVTTAKGSAESGQMTITFKPIVTGRTYLVQWTSSVATPDWEPLVQSNSSDNGNERTVTDLNAFPAPKFYRVQISKP